MKTFASLRLLRLWRQIVLCGVLVLFLATACSKQDPYVPPDLFYYFASYKVGKNPTSITPFDIDVFRRPRRCIRAALFGSGVI